MNVKSYNGKRRLMVKEMFRGGGGINALPPALLVAILNLRN